MGVMRFLVHPPDLAVSGAISGLQGVEQGFLTGPEGRVLPAQISVEGDLVTLQRAQSESAKFNLPWPIPGAGRPVLSTTSLRVREEPYLLPLELARGKLAEVRDQAAIWEANRLRLPDAFQEIQRTAFRHFSRASTKQTDLAQSLAEAERAIQFAAQAAAMLSDAYVVQQMSRVHQMAHHSPSLLGCRIDPEVQTIEGQQAFVRAFNAASIPVNWAQIEAEEGAINWDAMDAAIRFCADHRLVCRGGPIVDLSPQGLPEWLKPWKSDFLNLPIFVCDFVETVMSRYQGMIRQWEVAAYGNTGGALDLSEEHRLALVARVLESARRSDMNSTLFLRVDQPWGEYQRFGQHRLSPLQFSDALVRANLGLGGIVLELNVGYSPQGCSMRDMLSVSRMIDQWIQLGVPLQVDVACPSQASPDSLAQRHLAVVDGVWKEVWSAQSQADWLDHVVPLLLSKPGVTGVYLSHFSDRHPHHFPHAGGIDARGAPKPMLDLLRQQLHCDLE